MKFLIKYAIKTVRNIRQKYWKYRLQACGKNFTCCSGVIIHSAKKIKIGNNVRIGESSYFNGAGEISIGNNVKFGPRVFIWSSNHDYYKPDALPFGSKSHHKKVTIEDNVWIGACASLVPGVKVGEGAVVAMCSVVTKDVPPCAVVGGNPAKLLKYRDIEHYDKLKFIQN